MDEMNYESQNPQLKNEGLDIVSMVLGIVSIVCCWVWFFAWVPSVTGLTLGIICLADKGRQRKGFSIAGIVTSGLGLLLTILTFVFLLGMTLFQE